MPAVRRPMRWPMRWRPRTRAPPAPARRRGRRLGAHRADLGPELRQRWAAVDEARAADDEQRFGIGIGGTGHSGRVEPGGVLAVGGSAGGVEALLELVAGLPDELPAPVLVTVHIREDARSSLPWLLARKGTLPAEHARDGARLEAGRIYVAPPGRHLLTADGVVRLSGGPRVNRHRPAVDVMFTSAARWAQARLVAVVLSGVLDDGAVGAALVQKAGGRVVVQRPDDAVFPSMPRAALAAAPGAVEVPSRELGAVVARMLGETWKRAAVDGGDQGVSERRMDDSGDPAFLRDDEARLTRLVCPECSGALAEVRLPRISYYRCHVGHQYGPQSLEAAQRESVEAKLWTAVAALEEHAALARHLAEHDPAGADAAAAGLLHAAERSSQLARAVRTRLLPPDPSGGPGA